MNLHPSEDDWKVMPWLILAMILGLTTLSFLLGFLMGEGR
jgi:hypothetical protein